jgi:hypothetical protein
MLPILIPPLQFFKHYEFDKAMMENLTLHLARFGLDLVCHFCQTSMKVEGQIQRTPTCEMVHELEMVEYHSTISAFTCNIYLDFFEQVLPFFLQVGSRDIFLPNNTFLFRLEIRPELDVFINGCFKPSFTSPRYLCCCCNNGFINLHLNCSHFGLGSIKG